MRSPERTALTVRDLRRRWKPFKEALAATCENHPTAVRLHRAFSWLARVELQDQTDADSDVVLICRWVGFNSLYGCWDESNLEPAADRKTWVSFLVRILELDHDKQLPEVLQSHKPLVMSILDDEYLSDYFWEEPTPKGAGKGRRDKFQAQTWYLEGRWGLVLERLVDRIYLLRCQLMHGASTYGGKLNRRSLRHCGTMLGHLLPAILLVMIQHGKGEDWGPMCYPPVRNALAGNGAQVKR